MALAYFLGKNPLRRKKPPNGVLGAPQKCNLMASPQKCSFKGSAQTIITTF
jgi:hypothetical protein